MGDYFRMPAFPDAMPLDISFVFEDEKPYTSLAYKHEPAVISVPQIRRLH